MKEKDSMDRNERLREALHRGDPSGDEAGLSSDESQAMRRTVLAAVPEPRERFRLAPIFLMAAAVILSCAIGLSLWRMHDRPVQTVPPIQTAQPQPPAPQAAPQAQAPPAPSVEAAAASPPAPHPRHRKSVKRSSAPDHPVEVAALEEPQEATPRQVQFSAPGGTRIIWLLTEPPQETR
jgi:type II secretory pathway component PulM